MLFDGSHAVLGGFSFLGVFIFILMLRRGWFTAQPSFKDMHAEAPHRIEFIFLDDRLVDVSPNGKVILPLLADHSLESVCQFFAHRFLGLYETCLTLGPQTVRRITSSLEGDTTVFEIEHLAEGIALRAEVGAPDIALAQIGYRQEYQLGQILHFLHHAPIPMWMRDHAGALVFANAAYENLSFDTRDTTGLDIGVHRISMPSDPLGDKTWFDITVQDHGQGRLDFASNVTKIVRAEIAQRNFVQTLTKTFANLSIGLAIFDRNRQLVLFNPALIDLTELPAEFLSARPTLLSFFDKLRDQRVMPEPKDYSNWREQLAQLVVASSEGTYCEVWSLPSGATYRVSGRPHPDGAIALLFEDISEEIILTRRFRNETELNQTIMDALDTGFAVFSAAGLMISCNRAYAELWQVDHDVSLGEVTILDAIRIWSHSCAPSPDFADLRDFVIDQTDREEWTAVFAHRDGGNLHCKIMPLSGGMTLVCFDQSFERALAIA